MCVEVVDLSSIFRESRLVIKDSGSTVQSTSDVRETSSFRPTKTQNSPQTFSSEEHNREPSPHKQQELTSAQYFGGSRDRIPNPAPFSERPSSRIENRSRSASRDRGTPNDSFSGEVFCSLDEFYLK
jgi:hypothetical protein